jgi:hypothetical protein
MTNSNYSNRHSRVKRIELETTAVQNSLNYPSDGRIYYVQKHGRQHLRNKKIAMIMLHLASRTRSDDPAAGRR